MGQEIDLLRNYPKTKRDLTGRAKGKSEVDRAVARRFGKEFFDGSRDHGYGGFSYQARFWQPVIPDLVDHFQLTAASSVLDVGCAKGFMLFDLAQALPGIHVRGVDISEYAVDQAKPEVRDCLEVADAASLPFGDNSFDAVISVNTVHNLDEEGCAQALGEIQRVSRGKSFITVDAYRNDQERERMEMWNLTALTIKSVDDWIRFFKDVGYTGDYYWFIP